MNTYEALYLSKEPTSLTKEQRQIIQEALNSIPKERIETMTEYSFLTKKYCTWEGIEEQLERGNKIVLGNERVLGNYQRRVVSNGNLSL